MTDASERAGRSAPTLPMTPRARALILAVACLATLVYVFARPAIPQSLAYHRFADGRAILGLTNALNVLSNIPFLLVGIAGLLAVLAETRRSTLCAAGVLWPYVALFLGCALTAFGSAHYHLSPDNRSLVWDRLPMAIGFMGLLGAVIGERVGRNASQVLLAPLLIVGFTSVMYWHATEQLGRGDLRPYLLVQYGSLGCIVLLMIVYPARWTNTGFLWAALAVYAAAKLLEAADHRLFAIGHVISGHTLKHLAAACAVGCLVRMLRVRLPLQAPSTSDFRRRSP